MTTESWNRAPDGWTSASPELVESAVAAALLALSPDSERPAPKRLATFYDRSTNYAGSAFVELQPSSPDDITPADLHATTLLSVDIGPLATRHLLDPSELRTRVLEALAAVPNKELFVAGPDDLQAMESFYRVVKEALSDPQTTNPNAWVTASKLCARKRPDLFPVRDNLVCAHLGLLAPGKRGDYQVDWQVFRAITGDRRVIEAIDSLKPLIDAESSGRRVQLDTGRLRLLDAALWTWAARKG